MARIRDERNEKAEFDRIERFVSLVVQKAVPKLFNILSVHPDSHMFSADCHQIAVNFLRGQPVHLKKKKGADEMIDLNYDIAGLLQTITPDDSAAVESVTKIIRSRLKKIERCGQKADHKKISLALYWVALASKYVR